jgi:multiple sugar transport system ATP-binding protein
MVSIEFQNVIKRFGEETVIPHMNLTVQDKEFLVLVGPSGCGKSTTLNLIAGLEYATEGKILFNGQDVTYKNPREREIAMVFQSYALYPHLNTYENMAFGLRLAKMDDDEIDKRVREAADILQITELLDKKPKQMSGGQRQRVALGRAIVRNPSVFLLDEPLSNLDAKLRVEMRAEIIRLQKRLATTLCYVTHDQVEAMSMADRIVILDKGYVMQVGSPFDVYYYPENVFVAGFIGSPQMNFLKGKVVDGGKAIEFLGTKLKILGKKSEQAAGYDGKQVTVGIRPEHLYLGRTESDTVAEPSEEMKEVLAGSITDENILIKANVLVVEHLGASTHVMFEHEGERFSVMMDGYVKAEIDDEMLIRFYERSLHLFDAETKKALVTKKHMTGDK